MPRKKERIDHEGAPRTAYQKNRKRILATQDICGICGQPVDKSLKRPHPMSPTVDHIIPISRGGHPYDIENLQLAHFACNMAKASKIQMQSRRDLNEDKNPIGNYDLPQSMDWANYKAKD